MNSQITNRTLARNLESSDGDSVALGNNHFDFDFIVIGSGFGGSVSAMRPATYRLSNFDVSDKIERPFILIGRS